jgi:hypothetical protein
MTRKLGGAACCAPTVNTQQRCAAAALNAETAQHAGRYAAQGHLYTPGKSIKRLYPDLYSRTVVDEGEMLITKSREGGGAAKLEVPLAKALNNALAGRESILMYGGVQRLVKLSNRRREDWGGQAKKQTARRSSRAAVTQGRYKVKLN